MKKVVHYKNGPYLPLTENWIYELIKNESKYKPIIYCHGIINKKAFPAEDTRSLNPGDWRNRIWNRIFAYYPFFYSSLQKDKPILIHAHFGTSGYATLKLKRLMNIPLITTFYGQDLSMIPRKYPKWRKRYKKLFKEGECFLVEGSQMKKKLIDLGCPENKIIIQHIGIDLDKIKFKKRNYDKKEGIKILISASFREKKGIPYAIEAIGIFKKSFPKTGIKVTIIGDSSGDEEGEIEKRKIRNVIRKYKLSGIIEMLSFQSHSSFINNLYKHHIFISPSITAKNGDNEGGSPVSITEASASGMPIISTFHCDIPEVVLSNRTGYLAQEKNANELSEKLIKLFLEPTLWEKLGKEGRKHIEKNYDIKKQVVKLENIYERIIRKNQINN